LATVNFLRQHWFDLGFALAGVIGLFLLTSTLTPLAWLLWVSLLALLLHQFEEYRYPGYFPGMINVVMYQSRQPDRYPLNANTALIVNVVIGWLFYWLAARLGESALWLGIATMLVSTGNIVAHTLLFNLRGKTLYNPGLLTALLLFLPIVVYFFYLVVSQNLATPVDWAVGLGLGVVLNYVGILKLIDWLKDEKTPYIFPQRALLPATHPRPPLLTLTLLTIGISLPGCNLISDPADRYPANSTPQDTTTPMAPTYGEGQLRSAFFGLDNALPRGSNLGLCRGAGNADGMPVIFEHEVDVNTLQAGDFRVVTQSGEVGEVYCATLFPAIDTGELRTVLLVGEFGSAPADPPAKVEIVGNLLAMERTINFKSAQIAVTPLPSGPTLILAELVPPEQWQLDKGGGPRGSGSGCPQGTTQIVRAVWAGGVTKANGAEATDAERLLYRVTLAQSDGSAREVAPFALADLGDGDNNHLLCLMDAGVPRSVSFPAGHLADPNGDLNPVTTIAVMTGVNP
jgi:hypothetical protein